MVVVMVVVVMVVVVVRGMVLLVSRAAHVEPGLNPSPCAGRKVPTISATDRFCTWSDTLKNQP